MKHTGFRRRLTLIKLIQCGCGGQSKLIKRRNFPHGRKSGGRSYMVYKCNTCSKENRSIQSEEGQGQSSWRK